MSLILLSQLYSNKGTGDKKIFFFSRVLKAEGIKKETVENKKVICFNSLLRCVDFFSSKSINNDQVENYGVACCGNFSK